MELDPQDQDIIKLLTKIKNGNGGYPEELLAARRQSYLKHMAEIGLGTGAGTELQHAAKTTGGAPTVPPASSVLLEAALVIAIIAEAVTVAYFYREKIADLFKTTTVASRTDEATPAPAVTTSLEIQGITPSPASTATVPSATLSASPTDMPAPVTSTPVPGVADENNPSSNNTHSGGAVIQSASTPAPNSSNSNSSSNTSNNNSDSNSNDNGNQGNHYGQTPKPERTKDSGNNNNNTNGSNNNNDNPPQDNNNQNNGHTP